MNQSQNRTTVAFAWTVMVMVSLVPDIIFHEFRLPGSAWLFGGKILLLVGALFASFAWDFMYPLRRFLIAFLALNAAEWAIGPVSHSAGWSRHFAASFVGRMNSSQLLKLSVGLVMAGMVLSLVRSPRRAFLTVAIRGAKANPVWYLPIRRPVAYPFRAYPGFCDCDRNTCVRAAWGPPSSSALLHAVPLFPLALAWAAMNAFSEEYSYRAAIIATIRPVVGDNQALLLSSFSFGGAHFYGIPYGFLGVGIAACLGYVLGRVMLETEELFWHWFIHLVQDVVIFAFMAAGAVTPGGR